MSGGGLKEVEMQKKKKRERERDTQRNTQLTTLKSNNSLKDRKKKERKRFSLNQISPFPIIIAIHLFRKCKLEVEHTCVSKSIQSLYLKKKILFSIKICEIYESKKKGGRWKKKKLIESDRERQRRAEYK